MKTFKPIREYPEDSDSLERAMILLFKTEIYLPLVRELSEKSSVLTNSLDDLTAAIRSGRIRFYKGRFLGKMNSKLVRELRKLGALWDRKHGSYSIPQSKLTTDIRAAIFLSDERLRAVGQKLIKTLDAISPDTLAKKLKASKFFDKIVSKTDSRIKKSFAGHAISPAFTEAQSAQISKEYSENLQLYIKDFAEKEIKELRSTVSKNVVAGVRYEDLIKEFSKSYGVTINKAKFLARQETRLLTTKMQQIRYESAGITEYMWGCVRMPHQSKNGPYLKGEVRYHHAEHEGKIFSWSSPPIVNDKGDRKNPGQDYNCRCFAKPIMRKSNGSSKS